MVRPDRTGPNENLRLSSSSSAITSIIVYCNVASLFPTMDGSWTTRNKANIAMSKGGAVLIYGLWPPDSTVHPLHTLRKLLDITLSDHIF